MPRPALFASLLIVVALAACDREPAEAPETAPTTTTATAEQQAASADEVLHFTLRPPAKGAVFQFRQDLRQLMTLTATDGDEERTFGSEDVAFFLYAAEVVAADDDAATALDVAYLAGGAATKMGDEEADRPLPVVDHGYRVSRDAEGLSFAPLEGPTAISEAEERVLQAHFATLGEPDPLSAFLAANADFTVGRDVEVPAEALAQLFQAGGDETAEIRAATLTPLRGGQTPDGNPTGVFRLVAEVQYRSNDPVPMATLVDFEGEVEALTESARVLRVDLKGKSQIAGATRLEEDRTVALKGEGLIELRQIQDWP